MTKEEWKRVENALMQIGNIVKLNVDGYVLTLVLVQLKIYKNEIYFEVDSQFEFPFKVTAEIRKRFYPVTRKCVYNKSKLKKLSKRRQKELLSDPHAYYEYYSVTWTSFNKLKKHLIENNENIELISISYE